MLQTEFCNTLQHYILFFADGSNESQAVLFAVLEHLIRVYLTFIAKSELCVCLKIHSDIQKKTQKHIKSLVHELTITSCKIFEK